MLGELDASSLAERDRIEIYQLRTAYDRGGEEALSKAVVGLATNRPELFSWLMEQMLGSALDYV